MEPISKKRKVEDDDHESAASTSSSAVEMVDLSAASPRPLPNFNLPGPSRIPPIPSVPGRSCSSSNPHTPLDSRIKELLMSSPAHLFGGSGQNPQTVTTSWEQWLCFLATNLSPAQWQGYWLAHCALFGEQAVPVHLLSFFQGQSSPTSPPASGPHPNDPIHARYEWATRRAAEAEAHRRDAGSSEVRPSSRTDGSRPPKQVGFWK